MKEKPAVGFLINQLDGRYQSPLWHGIVDIAEQRGVNLVFFVGKSLAPAGRKLPRADGGHNLVYRMIDPKRLDGLIVASGSLANFAGDEELMQILHPFLSKPMVSIAVPVEGIASVNIDNRSGMKKILDHFIHVHRYKRIAFIRGPMTNPEAAGRFEAYRESLQEHGIPYDERLVVDGDFGPQSGAEAIRTLIDGRKAEFDAVCSSNDDMALGAFQALDGKGLRVPQDVAIAGFDDIKEMQDHVPPFTTVRQPFYEQGKKAMEILLDLIGGKGNPEPYFLPTELIVRESCGCEPHVSPYSFPGGDRKQTAEPGQLEKRRAAIAGETVESLDVSREQKELFTGNLDSLLAAFVKDMDEKQFRGNHVLKELDRIVRCGFVQIDNFYMLRESIYRLRPPVLECYSGCEELGLAREIFHNLILKIDETARSFDNQKMIRLQKTLWYVRNSSLSIISNTTIDSLLDGLIASLPLTGLPGCYLSLFTEPAGTAADGRFLPPRFSKLMMSCNEKGNVKWTDREPVYPTSQVLPESVMPSDRRCSLVVMPLFIQDEPAGFIVFEIGPREEIVYGLLREQVSSVLYSIRLFENKEAAETKLKKTMEDLQSSEERYKEMVQFLPAVVFETDLNLRLTFFNQAGHQTFGTGPENVRQGVSLGDYTTPEDFDRLRSYCRSVLQGEETHYIEFRLKKKDGSENILLSRATVILRDNTVRGIRWSAIDIKPLAASVISVEDTAFREYRLSAREKEILQYVLQGYKLREIAGKLFIAESTVKVHVGSVYEKIGVKNRDELFALLKEKHINRYGHDSFVFSLLSSLIKN